MLFSVKADAFGSAAKQFKQHGGSFPVTIKTKPHGCAMRRGRGGDRRRSSVSIAPSSRPQTRNPLRSKKSSSHMGVQCEGVEGATAKPPRRSRRSETPAMGVHRAEKQLFPSKIKKITKKRRFDATKSPFHSSYIMKAVMLLTPPIPRNNEVIYDDGGNTGASGARNGA